jgi:hypothetical protein
MSVNALELLYNWLIVEKNKLIIGKDSDNISLANKIRLLLNELNINNSVPENCSSLNSAMNKYKFYDAPDAIVQIRNAIVHSNHDKRMRFIDLDVKSKTDVKRICIWYIEISIIKILGYEGRYFNRTSKSNFLVSTGDKLPWDKK